ncbi:MAG: TonB-dependent receptor [Gammaproteobacteria bacterium]|nr:TonB-dependent receptor [Gammaproteobacteria bacterium]MDH3414995.1 TonB-dependent receptor [Gammaproteobacteria bacterium]
MRTICRRRYLGLWLITLLASPPSLFAQLVDNADPIDELIVTTHRRAQPVLSHAGNIERLDSDAIARTRHQHIHELLTQVSGVWLGRASGQEHLTAIRSPMLTGPGSCGSFLFLEDGIPIRPSGFCNVNSLFEINTEQAESVEVIRGPGSALYGSNALHGIINVLMPLPGDNHSPQLAFEFGANDFYRASAKLPFDSQETWLASMVYANDGGFRDDSGYQQSKLHLKRQWAQRDGNLTLAFSATDLDQDTAGFIQGEDAYKDSSLNRGNLNPEAFRNASSQRAYGIWTRSLKRFELEVRPFLRRSDMRFLQHFLPGQPLEENGHISSGVIASAAFSAERYSTIVGIDLEWSDLFLEQTQDGATQGSDFLVETRPEGKHYDYDVTSYAIAPYIQAEFRINEQFTLNAGLRTEFLRYDYNNRMLDGNTRDDGTVCGFGGCLYSRPADRADSFTNLAPKFALNFLLNAQTSLYANLSRGFRAPQATELYRLQSGQQVADLDSERLDSFEIGVRTSRRSWSADVTAFTMRKRDSVFRDAEGFNISGARSKHHGLEGSIEILLNSSWQLNLAASYARHSYDFDVVASRGETFVSGRDVDTAPRWLGNVELQFKPNERINAGLQWTTIGEYYLDAENRFRYPGHAIANLRAGTQLAASLELIVRLNNLTNRDYADRADYAFGSYRYFPGRGRELFAEIRYTP